MRNLTAIMLLLSACACQDEPSWPVRFADKPPLATVRMLEARLAREPCVGALDRWARRYSYRAPGGRLDKQSIVIGLDEAGHAGRPAGIYIEPVYGVFELDHSNIKYRSAWGIYDARRQVIRYWTCGIANTGPNIPPTLRPDLPM